MNIWEQISLRFVIDFTVSVASSNISREAYDASLAIVDRFSKIAHFVPVRKPITGSELATIFVREVIHLHGVPERTVTNRDTVFANGFWSDFHPRGQKGVEHRASSTRDGQMERLNSILEQHLRS